MTQKATDHQHCTLSNFFNVLRHPSYCLIFVNTRMVRQGCLEWCSTMHNAASPDGHSPYLIAFWGNPATARSIPIYKYRNVYQRINPRRPQQLNPSRLPDSTIFFSHTERATTKTMNLDQVSQHLPNHRTPYPIFFKPRLSLSSIFPSKRTHIA